MAIMVLVEAKAKAESTGELKESMGKLFPDTRAYDGCRGITAYQDLDDEQTVVLVEFWDTREHYERYLAWRTETGVIAQLVAMLEGEPSIRYFETMDA
ncbi:MAG: putative quinol monooxygenase [Acidobacteriota bacterium]